MLDFREFTALAVQGLTPAQARRVGKALDIAIIFGATEYATGNESLKDIAAASALGEQKMNELRELAK